MNTGFTLATFLVWLVGVGGIYWLATWPNIDQYQKMALVFLFVMISVASAWTAQQFR